MENLKWENIYRMVGGLTPLKHDCGRLCGKKCCSLQEEGKGMYLFPGEQSMFPSGGAWYSIRKTKAPAGHFTGRKPLILSCRGKCDREKRPLACRLFPLAPYIDKDGSLKIILDDDAILLCPLVGRGDLEQLDPDFREAVGMVWVELLRDDAVRDAVREYSARIDRQSSEPWRIFFKT